MVVRTGYAAHVLARLYDFFTVNAQWQRRLWNPGMNLALRELDEAVDGVHLGALSLDAVRWFAESLRSHVRDDVGIGSEVERGNLVQLLGSKTLASGGAGQIVLRLFSDDVAKNYLMRWESAVRSRTPSPSRERAARAIGAHLLDAGFSQEYLRRWLVALEEDSRELELGDVVIEAQTLCDQPLRAVDVLALFENTPPGHSPRPGGWLNRRKVRQWLKANGNDESGLPDMAHGE